MRALYATCESLFSTVINASHDLGLCSLQRRLKRTIAWRNDEPLADGSSARAHRWCSHLASTSKAGPATASLPVRPLPVTLRPACADRWVRFPSWGFLLVFYSNYSPKMYPSQLQGVKQTDRQTDGQTDRSNA